MCVVCGYGCGDVYVCGGGGGGVWGSVHMVALWLCGDVHVVVGELVVVLRPPH